MGAYDFNLRQLNSARVSFVMIDLPSVKCIVVTKKFSGDSRNKTRLAKVVVVANSKQRVFSWTQLVVKYTSNIFCHDYTLY